MAYTPLVWKNSPDTSTPISAENLNRMETGIQEALEKGGCSYVTSSGEYSGNYYYDIYKYTVDNADNLIMDAGLSNPYYYYVLEGWAKCSYISDDGFTASFYPTFSPFAEILNGTDFYDYNLGEWYSVAENLFLGYMDTDKKIVRMSDDIKNNICSIYASITSNGSGSLKEDVIFNIKANLTPTSSDEYKFSQDDVNNLCVYFRIKLDQVRNLGLG